MDNKSGGVDLPVITPNSDDYATAAAIADIAAQIDETDGAVDTLLHRAARKGWLPAAWLVTEPTPEEQAAFVATIPTLAVSLAPLFAAQPPSPFVDPGQRRIEGRNAQAFLGALVALAGAHASLKRPGADGLSTRDRISAVR